MSVVRRRRRRGIPMIVEASPVLAAEQTCIDEFALSQGWFVARILRHGVVDGFRHGVVDVVADQIHQLERAHPEAAAVAQHGIQGRNVRRILHQQAQRLAIERSRHPIDDEPGGRTATHCRLAPSGCRRLDDLSNSGVGQMAGYDLDERQDLRRIEEVRADDAFGPSQPRRQSRDRKGGGVRGEYRVRRDSASTRESSAPLMSRSSTMASTIKAAGAKELRFGAGSIKASRASRASAVIFLRDTRRERSARSRSRPRWIASGTASWSSTRCPAVAATSAIPQPIVPLPMTATA